MDDSKINALIAKIKQYNPSSDSAKIMEAYRMAQAAHAGQVRDSGEPYINHPLAVADILAGLQMDDTTIIAGLLHDVVEDTKYTMADIEEKFGHETVVLVDGVTKLSKLEFRSRQEHQAENLRKMFLAMANDIRIILIKLADRLHNMRTIKFHHSVVRQREIAEETQSIFAPLAHRLGMFSIKSELEDICFSILEPEAFNDLKNRMEAEHIQRDAYINEIIKILRDSLDKMGIQAEITGRFKSYSSIHRKMQKQQKDLNEIYDLNAIRVIVDSVKDCYGVLGVIHTHWTPIPGRFKDYIAMPKQNMYQSIHTTVLGEDGNPFEVQIRTKEMHQIAEYGIAAHWRYKEGKSGDDDFEKKVEWLRHMLEWQQELRDAREFVESVKVDLFSDNIYVFSPKGDVYELPAGSCPIDFAYRVHTQVGQQCMGAKVNRRMVPLDQPLQNGDIVEIITAKGRGPNRDWLKIVKTQQAKNKIRQYFRKESRDENIQMGREMFERECKKNNYDSAQILKSERINEVLHRLGLTNLDDLYAAIGYGALNISTVLNRVREEYHLADKDREKDEAKIQAETKPFTPSSDNSGVWVRGVDNIMVRFAHCCNPLPGDEIIGYVTRGKGVSIHRMDCPNIQYYRREEGDRLIEVGWGEKVDGVFQVEIEAISVERPRLTIDVMNVMSDTKTIVNGINITTDKKNKIAVVIIKLEVKTLSQLDYIIKRISGLKGILEVHRVGERHRGDSDRAKKTAREKQTLEQQQETEQTR